MTTSATRAARPGAWTLAGLRAAAAGLLALAAVLAAPARAQLRNTAHDLSFSSTNPTGVKALAASDNEICKFCHAPHRALSSELGWNHVQTASVAFNYGGQTTTTAGTTLATTLRAASKLCLGCHDGTVAIGQVNNRGGGAAGAIGMTTVASRVDAAGKLIAPASLVGVLGNMSAQHPVGIPYAAQTGYNGIGSAVPSAKVDNAPGNYWTVTTAGCATPSGVCTSATGGGTAGSRINLLPNTPGTLTNVGLECTTCHEPHNRYSLANFLRVEGTSSDALCRSCHNK